jgi:hypothetical protein
VGSPLLHIRLLHASGLIAMRGIKVGNEYADLVRAVDAPKTVWMALAVSLAARCGYQLDETLITVMRDEWAVLNDNGIVPQKPQTGADGRR